MRWSVHSLPEEAKALPGAFVGSFLRAANGAADCGLPPEDAVRVGLAEARYQQEVAEQVAAERGDAGPRRVSRVDRVSLRLDAGSVVRHDNGWVDVWGVATRVGVFDYEDPTAPGGVFREYRPPGEVLDDASITTLDGVPFTIDHPADPVDAGNARDLTHGWVLEVKADGALVRARVRIATRDAMAQIEAGKIELSCGYTAVLDSTPGVSPEGERYDAIQRQIRYNHLALVDQARAGHVARLRFDAARVQRTDFHSKDRDPMKRIKLTHDGKTLSAPAYLAAGIKAAGLRPESVRADMDTGRLTIEVEGEAPTELVLPMAMIEEITGMIAPGEPATPAVEVETPDEEMAEEVEVAMGGEPMGRGDALTRADVAKLVDARLAEERKRSDAQARHRASVERQACRVLDSGFDFPKHDTEDVAAATVAAVFADQADEAKALAAKARRGDAHAAGKLDAMFSFAVRQHADAKQREADTSSLTGKVDAADADPIVAARNKHLARFDRKPGDKTTH